MLIENFIKVSSEFLSLFKLKFEDNSLKELSNTFIKDQSLKIFDYNGNFVGKLTNNNQTYYIVAMLEEIEISIKAYKNEKEKSRFDFKYSIVKKDENKRLNGFYTSVKNTKNNPIVKNEFVVSYNGKFICKGFLDLEKDEFCLYKKSNKEKIVLKKDEIDYYSDDFFIKIFKLNNIIYYEKTFPFICEDPKNIAGGFEVNESLDKNIEAFYILEEIAEQYYMLLKYFNQELDSFVPGFYNRMIDKSLKGSENLSKRKLLKKKNEICHNVSKSKKRKRRKKASN